MCNAHKVPVRNLCSKTVPACCLMVLLSSTAEGLAAVSTPQRQGYLTTIHRLSLKEPDDPLLATRRPPLPTCQEGQEEAGPLAYGRKESKEISLAKG